MKPPRPSLPSVPRPNSSVPPQFPSSEPPTQRGTFFLGRYRVVDELGVGGMAKVHLARMDGPGGFQKWVAIKRIHPNLVQDDHFVDMFLDEARIVAGINHANVAQVFDLGRDENTYWIAMEYLHGEPLRELMRRADDRKKPMPPEIAARICSDAAEGLHAAHELRGKNGQLLGLVHRDVTPHNLFVTYDGYTKVVDFGIAKVADRLSSTRAGTLKGKLAYMSPEQVRGDEIDRRTDIFALGVVLWELTTGRRLFRMDSDVDTLEKVQACVVPAPSSIVPGYPLELELVVLQALAKQKEERFLTARHFARALQSYLVRTGKLIGPDEVSNYVTQFFADRIRKRDAHLAWAAEVTSTIDPGGLAMERSHGERDTDRDAITIEDEVVENSHTLKTVPLDMHRSIPASVPTAECLVDDDDEAPTQVAPRHLVDQTAIRNTPPPPSSARKSFKFGQPPPAQFGSTVLLPSPLRDVSLPSPLPNASHISSSGSELRDAARIEQPPKIPSTVVQADPFSIHQTAIRKANRWNTFALLGVVGFTAACVIAMGLLLVFKLRGDQNNTVYPQATSTTTVSTSSASSSSELIVVSSTSAQSASSMNSSTATSPTTYSTTTAPSQAQPNGQGCSRDSVSCQKPPAVQGYLTIVCAPECDQIMDQGRLLGRSPIVHMPTTTGQHRLTLRSGNVTKVISVIVVAGEVTQQKISMQ